MRRLLRSAFARKPATEPQQVALSPPPHIAIGLAICQTRCAFFVRLSAEIRLIIYEAVLSDPDRLLHIVSYRGRLHQPGLGHWHCEDAESLFPTWQHTCYGMRAEEGGMSWRKEPRSNSNLMSLPLTCRLMYVFGLILPVEVYTHACSYEEAIKVLYNANFLSFRGAAPLLKFQASLWVPNWDNIRRLNISSVFLVPKSFSMELCRPNHMVPPENYDTWARACATIGTLSNLQCLTVDLALWNFYDKDSANTIPPEDFLAILQPLNRINAKIFEVEVNKEPEQSVRSSLQPLNFRIKQRERPYNSKVFRKY
jgi:hypothetical protein